MSKKKKLCITAAVWTLMVYQFLSAQQVDVLPGGVLEKNQLAYVTGNHVRIRKGPSLEHEILTKVNSDTVVEVLEKGDELVTINNMKNYWYRIRLKWSGLEGWMYGAFLSRAQLGRPNQDNIKQPEKISVNLEQKAPEGLNITTPDNPAGTSEYVSLEEWGTVPEGLSVIASGDLDRDGVNELLFVNKKSRGRYSTINAYQPEGEQFTRVYSAKLRSSAIKNLKTFNFEFMERSLLVTCGDRFSYVYGFDTQNLSLNLLTKLNSPLVSFGLLDGENLSIVYLTRNRLADNDGTVTYYLHTARARVQRGKMSLGQESVYPRPLPIKKLTTGDLDRDNQAEIICEIGGKDMGGGVVILKKTEKGVERMVTSGVFTYNNRQFVRMWATDIQEQPRVAIYTTDPSKGNDANTDFGFLHAAMKGNYMVVKKFFPVNKMLDDINNTRKVILSPSSDQSSPYLILDYNQDAENYTVKRPIL
ncbi:MAG: SH3 domain-containing protein [Spirochaetota bacterium]